MSVAERIAQVIEMHGPVSVSQFMTLALHHPTEGYYARHQVIGAAGDFTTAPEISQIFGELVGAWLVQVWHDQDAPSPARLVEPGPGLGTLMADVLRTAKRDAGFISSIDLVLVEASERLRQIQARKLHDAPVAVGWTDRFDHSLSDRPLFLLANEFLDALPVRQFVFTERGWCERLVGLGPRQEFVFALNPMPVDLHLPEWRDAPRPGDIYEVSRGAETFVEQMSATIVRHGGAMLLIDYGYGREMRFGETLQAVANHRWTSVLHNPGEADLSSHVDFAALARSAESTGAQACGPVDQGAFLEQLGIRPRAERLASSNPQHATSIAAAVRRLTSAEDMGTLFKALAILPKGAPRPPGF